MKGRSSAPCLFVAAAVLGACEPWPEAPAPVVQSIQYTTNVYITQVVQAPPVTAASVPTRTDPPPPAPVSAPRSACDAYIDKARRCVRAITDDEAAHARAEEALERLRRAVGVADDVRRAELLRGCADGLAGYAHAPCE
jgi:hypothetical protein